MPADCTQGDLTRWKNCMQRDFTINWFDPCILWGEIASESECLDILVSSGGRVYKNAGNLNLVLILSPSSLEYVIKCSIS